MRPLTGGVRAADGVSAHISIGDAARKPPPITKSDEAFRQDGLEFVWGGAGIDVKELNELFERVCSQQHGSAPLLIVMTPPASVMQK